MSIISYLFSAYSMCVVIRMEVYTVSFFGHRVVEDPISLEKELSKLILSLMQRKEYVAFLVGRNGDFDQIVSSTIRRCKREYRCDNSAHILVLPYLTAEYRDNEASFQDYYDEIEVCEIASGSHFKSAFRMRNQAMVDRSHLALFYVKHSNGGAYQAMRYAVRKDKPYINLAERQADSL